MYSIPMQSDDDDEMRRNSTLRRIRLIPLTLGTGVFLSLNLWGKVSLLSEI